MVWLVPAVAGHPGKVPQAAPIAPMRSSLEDCAASATPAEPPVSASAVAEPAVSVSTQSTPAPALQLVVLFARQLPVVPVVLRAWLLVMTCTVVPEGTSA